MSGVISTRSSRAGFALVLAVLAGLLPAVAPPAVRAAAVALMISPAAPASVTSGLSFDVTVSATADGSTIAADFTGAVAFSSTDPLATVSPVSPFTYTNGTRKWTVTLRTLGSQTIVFSNASLGSIASAIMVNIGAAARLVVSKAPGSGMSASALTPAAVVTVTDLAGNVISTDSTTQVSLTLLAPPAGQGSGTLGGCTGPVRVGSGIATFPGCTVSGVGKGYTVLASDVTEGRATRLTGGISGPFDISTSVAFELPPGGGSASGGRAVAGSPFKDQPKLSVRWPAAPTNFTTDRSTDDSTSTINLAIKPGTGTAGAVLSCTGGTAGRAVSAGTITFAGCSIDRGGVGYVITATSSPAYTGPVDSAPFDVAGGPAKLVFTTQPGGGAPGAGLSPQPTVAIADSDGAIVSGAPATDVTLTLTNPGGATLACTKNPATSSTVGTAAGKASFSGCKVDRAGTYTLSATAPGLASATSNSFTVVAPPAAEVTLTASRTTVPGGQNTELRVAFSGVSGIQTFDLEFSYDDEEWDVPKGFAGLKTADDGTFSRLIIPGRSLWVRVVSEAAESDELEIVVRASATLDPAPQTPKTIKAGSSVKFSVTIKPYGAAVKPKAKFIVYKRVFTAWKPVKIVTVVPSSRGIARFTYKFTKPGRYYVRAFALATPSSKAGPGSALAQYSVK